MSYSIASCCHIGLRGLDLALRAKNQACIYIYIGSALSASLYIGIYTCIWAIYAQSKPCIHIYVCHIYVCRFPLVVNMHYVLCIYHFGMLQACRPTSEPYRSQQEPIIATLGDLNPIFVGVRLLCIETLVKCWH